MPRGFLVKRNRWMSAPFWKIRRGNRKSPEVELLGRTRRSDGVGSPPRIATASGSVTEPADGFFGEAQHMHAAERAGGAGVTTQPGDTGAGPGGHSVDVTGSAEPGLEISITRSRLDPSQHARPHADLCSFFSDADVHRFSSHHRAAKRGSPPSDRPVSPPPAARVRDPVATPAKRTRDSKPGKKPLAEFICQLCKVEYADPLSLAQHRCSRIARVDYRCAECDKAFSCPANLASHRRWHKPRPARPERWPHGARARAPPQPSAENAVAGPRGAPRRVHDAPCWPLRGPERLSFPCRFCGVRFPSADVRDEHAVWHAGALGSLGVLRLEEQIFLC